MISYIYIWLHITFNSIHNVLCYIIIFSIIFFAFKLSLIQIDSGYDTHSTQVDLSNSILHPINLFDRHCRLMTL